MSAVPKLRFPEFTDAWHPIQFGEFASLQSGYAFSSEYFGSVGRKLVTPKNFKKNGFGDFSPEITKHTSENVDEKFICSSGDILILMTDLTPSCELLGKPLELTPADGNVLLNQRIVRVDIREEKIAKGFLKAIMLGDLFHKRIVETASGSTVRHSSNRIINEITITTPSLPEQQKIASFLSSVDKKIDLLRQKKDALEIYRKGLMQKIFSQEIRFKQDDGSDFPDWEEVALGDVLVKFESGKSKSKHLDPDGAFVVIDMGGVDRQCQIVGGKRISNNQDLLQFGQLVMPKDDIGGGNIIGKVVFVDENEKYVLGDHVYALTVNSAKSHQKFLFYRINSNQVNTSLRKKANGTAQLGLGRDAVLKQETLICCLEEQDKIASFLSDVDVKIAQTSSQIEQMETFKKGLLQQMFV